MEVPKNRGAVLVVDNEPNILFFVKNICTPLGFEVMTAGSGLEALKIIQEQSEKIDLLILDLQMPGMGGLEVVKALRGHYPDLPFIVVTALHDKHEACEKLGCESFIRKPYSLEDLYAHVENILEQKSEEKGAPQLEPGYEPSAKILIVDDEEEVCEILGAALEEDIPDAHFQVEWAHSGDEALRVSREFEPDIGIIDIKMPHMWGDELIERFKSGEGHTPKDFVIHTSVTDPLELEHLKKMTYKLLSKPTKTETLAKVLKKICVRHKLLRKKE